MLPNHEVVFGLIGLAGILIFGRMFLGELWKREPGWARSSVVHLLVIFLFASWGNFGVSTSILYGLLGGSAVEGAVQDREYFLRDQHGGLARVAAGTYQAAYWYERATPVLPLAALLSLVVFGAIRALLGRRRARHGTVQGMPR